ncbi:MAG TPA: phosphonate C-P lyase system protein PhnH [Acidimicrobiales bacterium]
MTATIRAERLDRFESQAMFRLLLETLSRPGTVGQLPLPGLGAAAVALALADVETSVAVCGDELWAERIVRATGASVATPEEAELVACCGPTDAAALRRLPRGTALAPELGAKVGIDCRHLHAGTAGETTLTLSGPGVPASTTLGVDGLGSDVFDAVRSANADFPAGIDVWLIDDDGRIAGLPRTCQMVVS